MTEEAQGCPEGCACDAKPEQAQEQPQEQVKEKVSAEVQSELPEKLSDEFIRSFVEQTHKFLTNTRLQGDALISLLMKRGIITPPEMDEHMDLAIERYNQALLQQEGMIPEDGQDPEKAAIDEECGITIVQPDEEEESADEQA